MGSITELKQFIRSFWRQALTILNGVLLAVAFVGFFVGFTVHPVGWVAFAVIVIMFLLTVWRTWLAEYRQVKRLQSRSTEDSKKLSWSDLSKTQKNILRKFTDSSINEISVLGPRAGTDRPIYHGLGELTENYGEVGVFRAAFNDLVSKGVFIKERSVGMHDTPVYIPTQLFYEVKEEANL